MKRLSSILTIAVVLLLSPSSRAESDFWEEMSNPGITDYRALVAAGRDLIEAGDFQRALERLDQARALMPDEALAQAWRAYALSRIGRHDQAVEAWDRARAIDPEIVDDERLANECSLGLARAGRFSDAAELYGRMLARGVSPRYRAQVLVSMGDMLVAASCDGLEEAIELYQEAVRDYPDDAGAHFRLAAALHRAGHADEGEAELVAALRIDPQWQTFASAGFAVFPTYDVYLFRALSWQQLGHLDQARREWQAYLDAGGAQGCWAELAEERLEPARPGRRR